MPDDPCWQPDALVSTHFVWREFALSDSHPELVEPVPDAYRDHCIRLAGMLEIERAWAGGLRVRTWSGYRSPELNRAIGGSPTSQHEQAGAIDHSILAPDGRIDAGTTEDVFLALVEHLISLPCGQVIYYPRGRAGTAFIHLAIPSARYPEPSYHIHDPAADLDYRKVTSVPEAQLLLAHIPRSIHP